MEEKLGAPSLSKKGSIHDAMSPRSGFADVIEMWYKISHFVFLSLPLIIGKSISAFPQNQENVALCLSPFPGASQPKHIVFHSMLVSKITKLKAMFV
jgi:hypothetical protein